LKVIKRLSDISNLLSGIYAQSSPDADSLYLQAVHFDDSGALDETVKPQIKIVDKIERHLLYDNDILFAAKGVNNFSVLYKQEVGRAVASSSFIVIRLKFGMDEIIFPEYLVWYVNHTQRIKLFHQKKIGSTIPSISIKELSELEVLVPTIETQKLIVHLQSLRDLEKKIQLELIRKKDQLFNKQLLQLTEDNVSKD
jgi:restriction endonuclease S subunit